MASKNINKVENKVEVKQEVKSIVEVVVNGMTSIEIVEDVKKRIEAVEKSVFNIALECAYATGVTIPAYIDVQGNEHGMAIIDTNDKLTQAKLVDLVGRSKQAISRWCIAMKYIIEEGYFTSFATGALPFSYDKIIMIFENKEVFDGYVFTDLMSFSVKNLEKFVKKSKAGNKAEEEAEETKEATTEETKQEEENIETTVIFYNGKEYTVPKVAFEKWLEANAVINIETK